MILLWRSAVRKRCTIAEAAPNRPKLLCLEMDFVETVGNNFEKCLPALGCEIQVFEVVHCEAKDAKRVVDIVSNTGERIGDVLNLVLKYIEFRRLFLYLCLLQRAHKCPPDEWRAELVKIEHIVDACFLEPSRNAALTFSCENEDRNRRPRDANLRRQPDDSFLGYADAEEDNVSHAGRRFEILFSSSWAKKSDGMPVGSTTRQTTLEKHPGLIGRIDKKYMH